MTVEDYLRLPHRPAHAELIFGFMRVAARPPREHAALLQRLRTPLEEYLADEDRGDLFTAPTDVVLDEGARIVVRPPIVVVLAERRAIVGDISGGVCIRGAPDLVVEILTPANARRTRCSRLRWYRQWGVKECWFLDTRQERFEVLLLEAGDPVPHLFSGRTSIRSGLFPTFSVEVGRLFKGSPAIKRTVRLR